jgi:hypothetical protein
MFPGWDVSWSWYFFVQLGGGGYPAPSFNIITEDNIQVITEDSFNTITE